MKRKIVQEKGITLIALVITIIVLIILAGISVGMLTGNNGILNQVGQAKNKTEQAQLQEDIEIKVMEKEMNDDSSIENYLKAINGATVEKEAEDTYYVSRGSASYTVTDDGEVIEGKLDIWDGTSSETPEFKEFNWYIYNSAQFKFFADFVNNGNTLTEEQKVMVAEEGYNESDIVITESTVVYLMADLDLGARQTNGTLTSGTKWTPIGPSKDIMFIGTFEGNNHFIKGVYVSTDTNFNGIFGNSNTIKNLTIKNSYIRGAGGTGGIVGLLRNGTVENCHNINTTVILIEGDYYTVGGVVGQAGTTGVETTILNCSNSGVVTAYGVSTSTNRK